jgi:hypothetical protein
MSLSLVHDIKQATALAAATLAATMNGNVIDTLGFGSLTFLITVGDSTSAFDGTNNLTWKVQEGDLSDGSDMADIAAGDYVASIFEAGTAWDRKNDAAADDEESFAIGVRLNTKRYRRLVVTEAGVVLVPASAVAVLSHPRRHPAW